MGALAESFGLRQGIRYRGPIRDELETVLKTRSRRSCRAPPIARSAAGTTRCPGSSAATRRNRKSTCARRSTYNPQSVITRLFLAETLIELNRKAEARKELEAALAAPEDPEWAPEDREFKEQAKALLATRVDALRRATKARSTKFGGRLRVYASSWPRFLRYVE